MGKNAIGLQLTASEWDKLGALAENNAKGRGLTSYLVSELNKKIKCLPVPDDITPLKSPVIKKQIDINPKLYRVLRHLANCKGMDIGTYFSVHVLHPLLFEDCKER